MNVKALYIHGLQGTPQHRATRVIRTPFFIRNSCSKYLYKMPMESIGSPPAFSGRVILAALFDSFYIRNIDQS